MTDSGKKQHGGARPGAGRKTKYEKTVVMRVPEKYRDAIKAFIEHLDNTAYIDGHYPKGKRQSLYSYAHWRIMRSMWRFSLALF